MVFCMVFSFLSSFLYGFCMVFCFLYTFQSTFCMVFRFQSTFLVTFCMVFYFQSTFLVTFCMVFRLQSSFLVTFLVTFCFQSTFLYGFPFLLFHQILNQERGFHPCWHLMLNKRRQLPTILTPTGTDNICSTTGLFTHTYKHEHFL